MQLVSSHPETPSPLSGEGLVVSSAERLGGGEMKKRINILIEEEIIKRTAKRAAQEGRSLSDLIQDALVSHLSEKVPEARKREEAYQLFCEQPMRLSGKQFKEIMEEEPSV
jgi:hypothetical protein